jgi:hypothetical protein
VVVFAMPEDTDALLQALRRSLSLNPVDARIHVHNLPGLLPDRLLQDKAEHVAAAIRDLGVDAGVVPEPEVPDLAHATTIHHLRCGDDGLEVIASSGALQERIAWSRLALLSIGDVPLDSSRHSIAKPMAVIHSAPGIGSLELQTPTVHGAELWLIVEAPLQVFRVDHHLMNYEYLADRRTTSAAANFRLFVDDLLARAPHVTLTPSARAFLRREGAEQYRFDSQDEHRRAAILRFLLRRRARGAAREATAAGPAASSSELAAEHEHVREMIGGLRAWWRELDELGQPRFGEMGTRVAELEEHLKRHFAAEEQGGYMAEPLKVAPHLTDQAGQLLAEHAVMLNGLDALRGRLCRCQPDFQCWSDARQALEQLVARLQRHEHAENQIWQAAFGDETGSAD